MTSSQVVIGGPALAPVVGCKVVQANEKAGNRSSSVPPTAGDRGWSDGRLSVEEAERFAGEFRASWLPNGAADSDVEEPAKPRSSSVSIAPAVKITTPPPPAPEKPREEVAGPEPDPEADPKRSAKSDTLRDITLRAAAGGSRRKGNTLRDITNGSGDTEVDDSLLLSDEDVPETHPARNYTLPDEPSFEIDGLPEMDDRPRISTEPPPARRRSAAAATIRTVSPRDLPIVRPPRPSSRRLIGGAALAGLVIIGIGTGIAINRQSETTERRPAGLENPAAPADQPIERSAVTASEAEIDLAPSEPAEAEPQTDIPTEPEAEPELQVHDETEAEPVDEPEPEPTVATVRIQLRARPSNAVISIDGTDVSNPYETERPAEDEVHNILVTAEGYRNRSMELRFDRNRSETIRLLPQRPTRIAAAPMQVRPSPMTSMSTRPTATAASTMATPSSSSMEATMSTGAGFVHQNPY